MSATYATTVEVIALAPELASVDAAQLALVVDVITQKMLTVAEWGDTLNSGHRTLAAHWGVVELLSGAGAGPPGAVTSRRVDKIGESYAAPGGGSPSDAELASTKYGRMHIALRDTLDSATSFGGETDGWEYAEDGRVL